LDGPGLRAGAGGAGGPVQSHVLLDRLEQRAVAHRQRRFDRLEAVQVGRQRQPRRIRAVALVERRQAFAQPRRRQREAAAVRLGA